MLEVPQTLNSLFVGGVAVTQAQKEKDPTKSVSVDTQSPGLMASGFCLHYLVGCFVLDESGLMAGSQTIPLVILLKLSAAFWVLLDP